MPNNKTTLLVSMVMWGLVIWLSLVIPYEAYEGAIWPILLAYLGFSLTRYYFFFLGVAANETLKNFNDRSTQDLIGSPLVSIIVPAFNEAKVIYESLSYLSRLNYPNFEIIVVDDGSHDDTAAIARAFLFEVSHVRIEIIRKENGGKASALNMGIQHASGAYILCVDADSRIHPDSISAGVKHFEDPKIGTVAGFVEVIKVNSFVLRCQQLEYKIGLNFIRSAYSYFGFVPIVPGPIGLFRRQALIQAKGYTRNKDNFAEDAEMSLRLIANGWKIVSEPKMIAYTEAPEDWSSLLRQRYRWTRGTFQAIQACWAPTLAQSRVGPKILIVYLLFEAWMIPLINLCLATLFVGIWIRHGQGSFLTSWMAMVLAVEVLVVAVALSRSERFFSGVVYSVLSRFSYDILLLFWRVFCLVDEWTDQKMSWDKLTRTGALTERKI